MGTSFEIRSLQPSDETAWRRLWDLYTRFYEHEPVEAVTAQTFRRILDPHVPVYAIVAVGPDDRVIGFANYILHANTSTLADVCYLEDLYVDEGARSQGVGRALIEWLRHEMQEQGWARLYWHTHESNATARRVYDKFVSHSGFLRYVITNAGA